VSGCSKGCAHGSKAPLVIVADNGAYNIVVDGTASDTPILHGLGFGEAQACVKASARMEPQL
jgi:sulfite reductase beta subunit-like hemoprotein